VAERATRHFRAGKGIEIGIEDPTIQPGGQSKIVCPISGQMNGFRRYAVVCPWSGSAYGPAADRSMRSMC
jgi:hypothetical protein